MRFAKVAFLFLFCECLVFSVCFIPVAAQNPDNQPGMTNPGAQQAAPVDNQDLGTQQPAAVSNQNPEATTTAAPTSASSGASGAPELRSGNPLELVAPMRIGPGDDLEVDVFGVPELTQHARVSNSGEISLPLVGRLHLAGLSSDEAKAIIEKRLADGNFVNSPHVSLYVKEYTTEGISLIGEVSRPGVYSALAGHRLLDLIQTAGGLTPKAGRTVRISHRADPNHPTLLSLSDDTDLGKSNIELVPGDTVVVSKAGIVYVVGEVNRPGGFVMEGNKLSASQALALAAGPTHSAALNGAKIIRHTPDGLKDTTLPLKKIMDAKAPDMQLQPDDIIWIPGSKGKGLATTGVGSILSMLTTLAIYHL
jgi:polysaccharide export outer membrane protein